MKNIIIKKEHGFVSYRQMDMDNNENTEFVKNIKKYKHLCGDCDNCSPLKCAKVFDIKKEVIKNYDFITDGYQVYDENGEVKTIYVANCEQFVQNKARKKAKTSTELEELKRMKENLKMMYFDTESFDEAEDVQYDLLKRGQIYIYSSKERRR